MMHIATCSLSGFQLSAFYAAKHLRPRGTAVRHASDAARQALQLVHQVVVVPDVQPGVHVLCAVGAALQPRPLAAALRIQVRADDRLMMDIVSQAFSTCNRTSTVQQLLARRANTPLLI